MSAPDGDLRPLARRRPPSEDLPVPYSSVKGCDPMRRLAVLTLILGLAFPVTVLHAAEAPGAASDLFAITNVRVFDGTKSLGKAVVVVRGGKIEAVGPKTAVPPGAKTIDGAGGTLLPGF